MRIFNISTLFAICFLSACSSAENGGEALKTPLGERVGVIMPLSGKTASAEAAAEILAGMQLAQDEINARGGVGGSPLKLDIRDSAAPEFAFAETIDNMSLKGVKHFHIALTDSIVSRFRIFDAKDDCFFNLMTTYPPATTSAKNTTRIFINGAQQGDILTEKIQVQERKQSYVIMNVDTMCGRSNAAYIAFNLNRNNTKCYSDVFASGEKNFEIFSEQIIRLAPKYVFYIGDGAELNAFSASVKKSGFDGVLLATCGTVDFDKIQPRQNLRFGKIRTSFDCKKVSNEVSKKFRQAYKNKFGRDASWLAAYGYDSVILMARAAEGKGDAASMRAFFTDKVFDAAVGKLKFDNCADSLSELEIVEVK